MKQIVLEQALYLLRSDQAPVLQARSAGFLDSWRSEVAALLLDYGIPPSDVNCPSAVFAQPLGKQAVAVVHVTDRPQQTEKLAGAAAFHIIVLAKRAYEHYLHDPFYVAAQLPPLWHATELPTVCWPMQPLPARTVADVQKVLQRVKASALVEDVPVEEQQVPAATVENAESPALLGGVQVLIDGGQLVFQRSQPDTDLLQALWTLLPRSNRAELWPASYAFNNQLPFDVLVVPRFRREEYEHYLTEDQAADYPEGRYEMSLQYAAEHGDQAELDNLFERRSLRQTWRLGITLVVGLALILAGSNLLGPPSIREAAGPTPVEVRRKAARTVGLIGQRDPLAMAAYLSASDGLRDQANRDEP